MQFTQHDFCEFPKYGPRDSSQSKQLKTTNLCVSRAAVGSELGMPPALDRAERPTAALAPAVVPDRDGATQSPCPLIGQFRPHSCGCPWRALGERIEVEEHP